MPTTLLRPRKKGKARKRLPPLTPERRLMLDGSPLALAKARLRIGPAGRLKELGGLLDKFTVNPAADPSELTDLLDDLDEVLDALEKAEEEVWAAWRALRARSASTRGAMVAGSAANSLPELPADLSLYTFKGPSGSSFKDCAARHRASLEALYEKKQGALQPVVDCLHARGLDAGSLNKSKVVYLFALLGLKLTANGL